MSRLSFSNWALLAGLAALIIPILIHLLLRRKKQRLRFSTLQFFLKLDEKASQRRKLRNLALLAVRLLLVALVDGGKRAEIISPLVPPARLKPVLDKLQPGFGGGDLSEGLQQAGRILSESAIGRSSAIYVISDFQRTACERMANVKIPRNIQINV